MGTTNTFTPRSDVQSTDNILTLRGSAAGAEGLTPVSVLTAYLDGLLVGGGVGLGLGYNASSNASGNTTITLAAANASHTEVTTLSGSGSTTRIFIMAVSGTPTTGATVRHRVVVPATAGITLEWRNATSGGTLLASYVTTVSGDDILAEFYWDGTAIRFMGFVPATVGASADTVDIRSFGAKGDGVTDDRAALVAAVVSGAKTVYVPPGTYLMTAQTAITIPAGVSIIGAGKSASIFYTASASTVTWFTHAGTATIQGVQFKTGQTLDYTSLLLEGILLHVTGSNTLIRDCHFEQSSKDHIFVQNAAYLSNVTVVNCSFLNAVRGCIVYIGGDQIIIEANQINSPGYSGIDVEAEPADYLGNVGIFNNTILNARLPIQVAGVQTETTNYNSSNATISGNVIRVGAKVVGTVAGAFISVRAKRAAVTGNVASGEVYSQVAILQHVSVLSFTGNSFEQTIRASAESVVKFVTSAGHASGNSYRTSLNNVYTNFYRLEDDSIIWASDEVLMDQTVLYNLLDSVEVGSLLMGATRNQTSIGGTNEHRFRVLGLGNSLAARAFIDVGDLVVDALADQVRLGSRTAGANFLTTNAAGKVDLLLSAFPTSAGAAGALYNSSGLAMVSGSVNYPAIRALLDLEAGTDFLAYPTGTPTGSKYLRDDNSWQTITGGGDALVANPLSQFAPTTSAQLRGVLSDESGTGNAYFQGGDIGTPSAGVLTNATGLPISTGVTGLGAGAATFLATPSGANLAAALTTALPASKGGTGLTALAANVVSMLGAADNAAIRSSIGSDNYTAHGAAGAAEPIDATVAWHSLTLDANTTLTISNWPSSGTARTITLEILQDATGSRTIAWPAGVLTPPTIDSTADSVTLVTLSTRDAGTTIYALSTAEPGGGDALVANPLSQFAATTSDQLAVVLSDETGSGGGFVRATAPTISTPNITGIATTDGASVTTPNALGALAIDVTKGLNTKTISAPEIFTFSGTPATANTWFSVAITNSDASAQVATIPSSYSMAEGAAITTVSVPGLGKVHLIFRYDGSAYFVYGDPAAAVLPVAGGGTGASTVEGAWVTLNVPASTAGGTAIDWALSRMHARTLAANTTFTFANAVDGQEIRVAVTNTAGNFTVTWPTVLWPGGTLPVQTVGAKTDVYTFVKIGSSIYGSVFADYA